MPVTLYGEHEYFNKILDSYFPTDDLAYFPRLLPQLIKKNARVAINDDSSMFISCIFSGHKYSAGKILRNIPNVDACIFSSKSHIPILFVRRSTFEFRIQSKDNI